MGETIEATLAATEQLASPVARSCHVGNNTSNVWGWLALSRNTKLVQFDHTRYGMDENCLPWLVLGPRGRIAACYDHDGAPSPQWIGRHVNEHLPALDRRYFGHLNYGIHARYGDGDLLLHHVAVAAALSQRMNGSVPSFDSAELLTAVPLVRDVVAAFVEARALDAAFDRWVRTSRGRRAYIVSQALARFEYPRAGEVEIVDTNGLRVFAGDARALSDRLIDGAEQVRARLTRGTPVGKVAYPWFTTELAYAIQSVLEYRADPRQRRFWHAGGSSSQYYINELPVRASFARVRDVLAGADLLPAGYRLTMIPTYGCQLFATAAPARAVLDEIVRVWRAYLGARRPAFARRLLALHRSVRPFELGRRACELAEPAFLRALDALVDEFDALDRNVLPVAHAPYLGHPTYNKYGAAQHELLDATPQFAAEFRALRWEEAELLVKVLAHVRADRLE